MSDTSAPVLVYERIDANRRNTLLLLPAFGALLLPLAYSLTQLLFPFFLSLQNPWMMMMPTEALQVAASVEAATLRMVLLALALAFCVALAGYFASTYFVLWLVDGCPADRRKELVLCRTVENLCLGAGLSQPAVYVVESSTPNAFSTARDPKHASLIVTRGLLQLLDERELRGVLAHELSHIGNRDTDLSNLLAALVAMTRLPLAGLKAFVALANAGSVQALFGAAALL